MRVSHVVKRRVAVLLAVALAGPVLLAAQAQDPLLEGRLLRSAASQESQGNLDEAETILRDLMDQRPTSSGGLFALERVLRSQGRVGEILPVAGRYVEREPAATTPRVLILRILAEMDLRDQLTEAAEEWIAQAGQGAEPYREVSRVFQEVFGPQSALAVLERGRSALNRPRLFAMEVGDLLSDLGRMDEAVLEWAEAVGDDGAQGAAVEGRVAELGPDRAGLAGTLVERLARPPTTLDRRRAGARIALDAGLVEQAKELAEGVSAELDGQARRGFLTAFARQAEESDGAAELTLWAYEELRTASADPNEDRALAHRIADAALVAGDTVAALEALRSAVEGLPEESPERRRALAEVLRLRIAMGAPDARQSLERFRAAFPGAPETDELAVTLAVHLERRGDEMGARSLLAGVEGPRGLLERGYLYLASGEVVPGRGNIREAIPGVSPVLATDLISLLGLLDELQGDALAVVMRTAVLAHRGRIDEAVSEVTTSVEALPRADRPAVLAHGARLADSGGLTSEAADLRARIVRDHPDAAEGPEATLELARFRGASDGGVQEAIRLLEELILREPENAVVPMARRELLKLRNGRGT